MKKRFSNKWISSKQKRKQRKYRYNAPRHIQYHLSNANLSKELRKKYGKRSISIRKNDVVVTMRGKFKKKSGKVISVDLKRGVAFIENIHANKKDGSKVNVPIHISNLQIKELDLADKKRIKLEDKNIKDINKEMQGGEKK